MSRRTTSPSRTRAPRHAADAPTPDWDALERWAHPSLLDRLKDSLVAKAVLGTLILGVLVAVVISLMLNSPDRGTVIPPASAHTPISSGPAAPGVGAPESPGEHGESADPSGGAASAEPVPAGTAEPATPANAPLIVYVTGQVATPGVVQLPPGSRVHDALVGAGGPTPEADLAALNLARPVQDGEHIHVVKPGEEPPATANQAPDSANDSNTQRSAPGTGAGGSGGSTAGTPGAGAGTTGDQININTADLTQLQELPGVGPSIGQRIIDHREANGPFRTVDDLLDVKGIGPATLEKIRDRATV